MSTRWRGTRLTWKITGAFLGTLLVFGILVIAIVYHLTRGLLYEQINKRTLALATNLGDAAAGQIPTKNLLVLHAMVAKYALQEGVAYAFIEDRNGRILAHSLGGKFPAELQTEAALGESRQTARRNLIFRSRPVYETSVAILGGRSGIAHVIMWGDVVEAEIQRALAPIIGLIGLLLLVGVIISLRLSRQIVRPIIRLRSMADTMSKGNLDDQRKSRTSSTGRPHKSPYRRLNKLALVLHSPPSFSADEEPFFLCIGQKITILDEETPKNSTMGSDEKGFPQTK